ncbi:MAG TPA: sodium/solute symporter [Phycisphaerae bacterium]|nr:sodium/solute symporter [Phycisphaerae bacterium]
MQGAEGFSFHFWDYAAIIGYFAGFSLVGLWAGRKHHAEAGEYFLAGRTLPWYVVGGSFISSNISSEHFIGMVGAAFIYGICVSWSEWGNILAFSILIWFFIPFLLASGVFTTPEFLEKRFHPFMRQSFAAVTIISNIVAFLAAVLYGGGLAIQKLFDADISLFTRPVAAHFYTADQIAGILPDWNLWFAILLLGIVAGAWTIYGGLSSVAWTDFFALIIMIAGGFMVTFLGLAALDPEGHSVTEGWRVMIERNQGQSSLWADFIHRHARAIANTDHYNRLSIIQPASHATHPWPSLILDTFSVGIWYNVINQFMIQRVLGAKNMYHARMGIVLAGYMKIILPALVVVPGLILFAHPSSAGLLQMPLDQLRAGGADRGYMHLLQIVLPVGVRGLFLAALIGAIQSTVNSVLNSTATVLTLDIYRRHIHKQATEKTLVRVGKWSTVVILALSIALAGWIKNTDRPLFVYIQELYAFFAPPFSAVFLLGILWRRINAPGAIATVVIGFALGIALKVYAEYAVVPDRLLWIKPFAMQGIINWAACSIICIAVSLATARPRPEQVTDDLAFNWRRLNIFGELGTRWYNHVLLWWGLFVAGIIVLMLAFSGLWL